MGLCKVCDCAVIGYAMPNNEALHRSGVCARKHGVEGLADHN
jgi:hypothetical protein